MGLFSFFKSFFTAVPKTAEKISNAVNNTKNIETKTRGLSMIATMILKTLQGIGSVLQIISNHYNNAPAGYRFVMALLFFSYIAGVFYGITQMQPDLLVIDTLNDLLPLLLYCAPGLLVFIGPFGIFVTAIIAGISAGVYYAMDFVAKLI